MSCNGIKEKVKTLEKKSINYKMSSQPLYSLNSIHSVNADFCNMIGP
jgi:hypothetical protein